MPAAVDSWLACTTSSIAAGTRIMQDRPLAKVAEFRGPPTDMHEQSLQALARRSADMHALAHWVDEVGGRHWVHVHDGMPRFLQVSEDRQHTVLVTIGPRVYGLTDAHTPARMGRGCLTSLLGHRERVWPRDLAPVGLLLDAHDGLARPTNHVAAPWWNADLRWDGDAFTATDIALGRLLRDTCTPRLDSGPGGWEPWAWAALTAWATTRDVCAGELARAVLCAAGRSTSDPVSWDAVQTLARLDVDPATLIAAARALAPAELSTMDLAVTLASVLAPTPA